MSVALQQGQSAGPDDLTQLVYRDGVLTDPFSVEYEVYEVTTGTPALVQAREPATRSDTGIYYAPYVVPLAAVVGDWLVKWYIVEVGAGPELTMNLKFNVVDVTTVTSSPYDDCTLELLKLIRIVLRDNNPDRNYHFSPPTREKMLNKYTTKVGYLWEDEELVGHMQLAVCEANMRPPVGSFPTCLSEYCAGPYCFIPIIGGAASAVRAMATNWIEEEFSYSIGGVSLDISKANLYMSMKENLEGRFDQVVEDYLKNGGAYVIRGLSQGYYGIGFTAALGPALQRGTLSARSFVGNRSRRRS